MRRLALVVSAVAGCAAGCSTTAPVANVSEPAGTDCFAGQRLAVGAICRLKVEADLRQVQLPITLVAGDNYVFEVFAGSKWNDWTRDAVNPLVGDVGSRFMNLFKALRRMRDEPWMTMGISVSNCPSATSDAASCKETAERVGQAGFRLAVSRSTTVNFFANDIPSLNCNNRGESWIVVTRK